MTWFIAAWIIHGRLPLEAHTPVARLGLGQESVRIGVGELVYQAPILPPAWLLVILALLTLVALAMMFVGLQDSTPILRKNTSDKHPLNPEP